MEISGVYRFLIAFLLTFATTISVTQISISAGDFSSQFVKGNKIITYLDRKSTNANIGTTGKTSWDFTSLAATDEFVTEVKEKSGSPYAADFAGAQYAANYSGTFEGTYSNTWVYNSVNSNFITYGTGTKANTAAGDLSTKIKFDPAWVQYELPLEFGKTSIYKGVQTITSIITIPGFGEVPNTLSQDVTYSKEVDAYGEVIMPDGKRLNALRIKQTNTINKPGQASTSVTYIILTKTGESVSITPSDPSSTSGTVSISSISWTTGNVESNPIISLKPPSGLSTVASGANITIAWSDNSDNETSFIIERKDNTTGIYSVSGTVGKDITSYTDKNAIAGATYTYRVKASNSETSSEYSTESSATVQPEIVKINAPSGLKAEIIDNNIKLTWIDNSDNETGFKIERSVGNNAGYTLLAEIQDKTTTYSDASVEPNLNYYYRVYAFNKETSSDKSNEAEIKINITEISSFSNESISVQNYPNPSKGQTIFTINLTRDEHIILEIFDISGKSIVKIADTRMKKGKVTYLFDAAKLGNGIYLYSVKTKNHKVMRKMIVSK